MRPALPFKMTQHNCDTAIANLISMSKLLRLFDLINLGKLQSYLKIKTDLSSICQSV